MAKITTVHLFGSLRRKNENSLPTKRLDFPKPIPIIEVLERIRISPGTVQIVMINNRAVHKNSEVKPGDRVALFPRDYPIFIDWKDFR